MAQDCTSFSIDGGKLVAVRPIYAGKAYAKVTFNDDCPQMATPRPKVMVLNEPDTSKAAEIIDAAFTLEFHGIHGGADTVLAFHVMDGVNPLGIEKHAFGERGFPRIDVRTDADVSDLADVAEHDWPRVVAGVAGRGLLELRN